MGRCQHPDCQVYATFNWKGRQKRFCKKHAQDGMVNVRSKQCLHESCARNARYTAKGTKTPSYCKQHAEEGMVNALARGCSHDSCAKLPSYGFEASKLARFCKEHAKDGMVNVVGKKCLNRSCMTRAGFNIEGRKEAYCKKHADHGMVNVVGKKCLNRSCMTRAGFNILGRKEAYCKKHAEGSMVNVRTGRSSPFQIGTSRGRSSNLSPRARTRDESETLGGSLEISKSSGSMAVCRKRSRWELDEVKPPRRLDHDLFRQSGVGRTTGIYPPIEGHHASSSIANGMPLNDNSIANNATQTGEVVPPALALLLKGPQPREPVKIEMELVVSL